MADLSFIVQHEYSLKTLPCSLRSRLALRNSVRKAQTQRSLVCICLQIQAHCISWKVIKQIIAGKMIKSKSLYAWICNCILQIDFEYCLVLIWFSSQLALPVFDGTGNRWFYLLQSIYSVLFTNVLLLERI